MIPVAVLAWQADIEAISAQGAHALPIITALTVQDHNRVYSVYPVAPEIIVAQARALLSAMPIHAIKFGIVGSRQNAEAIAELVREVLASRMALSEQAGTNLPSYSIRSWPVVLVSD